MPFDLNFFFFFFWQNILASSAFGQLLQQEYRAQMVGQAGFLFVVMTVIML